MADNEKETMEHCAEGNEAAEVAAENNANQGDEGEKMDFNGSPVGVDVGTSKIVFAGKKKNGIKYAAQRNAFIMVEFSKVTEQILKQNKINHYKMGDNLVVCGDHAETFATILNAETRRPMRYGLLNPKEEKAVEIIKVILDDIIGDSDSESELCFSIPGVPDNAETNVIYHEAILNRHLSSKGYATKSINEGLSVVFSELGDENFTGLGISCGGGMCNLCLAYLSVPLISFSINKGGDYIDEAAASVTGEGVSRIRNIKENELDLSKKPANDVEDALHIYYDDLIMTLVKGLKENISKMSKIKISQVDRPIPIVLSGGTAKPNGFKERFEAVLDKADIPLEISEVRLAEDPLYATAKGALIAANY